MDSKLDKPPELLRFPSISRGATHSHGSAVCAYGSSKQLSSL